MNLGLFMMPLHPPGRTLGDAMGEARSKALLAEELGFSEVWLGEHFSAASEPIPSPLMFLASLLGETRHLTFGTGVINLPNRHPALIAAEVAQFDHMAEGRFRFGIGTGSLPSDFELFQIGDEPTRRRMLLESIDMIERIWRQGPPYEFNGDFWQFAIRRTYDPALGIGVMPKPRSESGPPVHISVSSPNSQTAALAGARGWGPISSGLIAPETAGSHWAGYKAGLEAGGRPVSGENWRVVRCVLVAPTDAQARQRVYDAQGGYRYYFGYLYEVLKRAGRIVNLRPRPDMRDEDVTVEGIIESRVIYGSPETVLQRLIAYRDQVGPFGHLLVSGVDWSGPNEAWERESMRLLAHDVMPRFRRSCAASDP